MKWIFFLLVLGIYFSINGYVYIRGLQILPGNFWLKTAFSLIFWILSALFIIRMVLGEGIPDSLSAIVNSAGFTWIVAVIYLAIIILSIDILRVINHFFDIWPSFIRDNYVLARKITAITSVSVTALLLTYGYFNFRSIKTVNIEIKTDRYFPGNRLRVVLISDLHLSSYIREDHLKRVIEKIDEAKPDILLIAGDITDRNLKPLKEWGLADMIAGIKTTHGIYAISGNHEYYGGERDEIYKLLQEKGINILLDSVVTVDGQIQIAGREDRTNAKRKSLGELLKDTDREMPIILLDHQPFNLDESVNERVDIQFSGHTHNGQFWPGNLIVDKMYELGYGYMQKGDTHFYVTSGAGIWGPKIRIGSQTEVVVADIISGEKRNIHPYR
jgi:hypothetical protein